VLQLAGILLDTQNLNASDKSSMTRDSEAVQLLLVGSAPNYRYALFDQRMFLFYASSNLLIRKCEAICFVLIQSS
jgi:hypothetical protein